MHRRAFLAAGAAASLVSPVHAAPQRALIKSRVLRPGDRVAVINPSTPVHDPAAATRAAAVVEALGLVPVIAPGLLERPRDLKASVRARLDELHGAFSDASIRGVFCARGGYGVSEIVSGVDYGLLRRNPKVFVGFSDLTLLQLAMQNRAGLVTFHGRMAAMNRFPRYSLEALRRAVCTTEPLGEIRNPEESYPTRPAYPLRTIAAGQAAGRLVGGNLSMIAAAIGTPWEIDTRGAILFFEDVGEAPYAIARMLWGLKQAGKLAEVAGIVIGACSGCEGGSDVSPYTLNEVYDQTLGDLKVPVFSGLALGHTDEQLTLPIGVSARMDAERCSLTVLESGVTA